MTPIILDAGYTCTCTCDTDIMSLYMTQYSLRDLALGDDGAVAVLEAVKVLTWCECSTLSTY